MAPAANNTPSDDSNNDPSQNPDFGDQTAFALWQQGIFPQEWAVIPVAGKDTYVKGWNTTPLTHDQCASEYRGKKSYRGLGVVTGRMSNGLIAIDIDGPQADERYREAVTALGGTYEAMGEETTMSWTSGRPGRRQIMYMLPRYIWRELDLLDKLILRLDGSWEESQDNLKTRKEAETDYEEVVIRFNNCMSVLPASPHPDTKEPYRFLNYNEGKVAPAPMWLVDLMTNHQKPVEFLSQTDLDEIKGEVGETIIPSPQIRGWFFKEDGDVQKLLRPRLFDVIFKHGIFARHGWIERAGNPPQALNLCPWHEGTSATAFQVNTENGVWHCKACEVGGDVLDFVHKVATGDINARRPMGPDLEKYVARIATDLGLKYPEDAQTVQKTTETPKTVMSADEFFKELNKIFKAEQDPSKMVTRMGDLALETGRRMTGQQALDLLMEHRYYERGRRKNEDGRKWWEGVTPFEPIVPDLVTAPSQMIIHAAGGLGKTSTCMGLVRAIINQEPVTVRGVQVPVKHGPVLWISNDQSEQKLVQDCEDNGIDYDSPLFIVKTNFQVNYLFVLTRWIQEYKPVLVVIDSLGSSSSRMVVKENDKSFAAPLYELQTLNGSNDEDGFPSCAIMWIHHDNANGELRGTRYLAAAVDETWHLRVPTEEEQDYLREHRKKPGRCRLIEIKKSRLGRSGSLLVSERGPDFDYSINDFTPTQQREENGQGDPDPFTMVLKIIKDATEDEDEGIPVTKQEVYEQLKQRMVGLGLGGDVPHFRTVERWVDRWVKKGLVEKAGKSRPRGPKGGRPSHLYRIHSRGLSYIGAWEESGLSETPPNPLQQKESDFPTGEDLRQPDLTENPLGDLSVNPDLAPPEPGEGVFRTPPECGKLPETPNPVVATDLSQLTAETALGDTHVRTPAPDAHTHVRVENTPVGSDVEQSDQAPASPVQEQGSMPPENGQGSIQEADAVPGASPEPVEGAAGLNRWLDGLEGTEGPQEG